MAEQDDIRLRQQVAPKGSPGIRDRSKPVKGIDAQGLITQTSKKISAVDKARKNAESTLMDDVDNQLKQQYFISQAKIAQAEKLQVQKVVTDENERLNKFRDDLLNKGVPPHLRDQMGVRATKSRLPLEKFAILHSSKEIEAHSDAVRKSTVEMAHQSAVLNAISGVGPGGKEFSDYAEAVKTIRDKTIEHGESKGFDPESAEVKFMADQAESKVVLDSVKGLSENATFGDTQAFYDTYVDKLTGEDKTSALKVLDQAKVSNKNTIAQALLQDALRSSAGDPAQSRAYIEANSPNGDVTVAAISALDNKMNFDKKIKKQQSDKKLADAKTAVKNNKGLVSADILNLVGPEHHDDLISYGNALQGNIQTDPATYGLLEKLRAADPNGFANENLDKYQDKLNPKDLERLKRGQESARNRNTSRAEGIKYSTSQKVRGITKQIINAKGISQDSDPEGYLTMQIIGDDIYDRVIESMPNETDMRKIEREYLRQFRAETYKVPVESASGVSGFLTAIKTEGPLDALFGDRPFSTVTQTEAIARQRAGENVLDIDDADPRLIDQMKATFKNRKGREITEDELQLWINRDAEKFLRLENGRN